MARLEARASLSESSRVLRELYEQRDEPRPELNPDDLEWAEVQRARTDRIWANIARLDRLAANVDPTRAQWAKVMRGIPSSRIRSGPRLIRPTARRIARPRRFRRVARSRSRSPGREPEPEPEADTAAALRGAA